MGFLKKDRWVITWVCRHWIQHNESQHQPDRNNILLFTEPQQLSLPNGGRCRLFGVPPYGSHTHPSLDGKQRPQEHR